MNAQAMLQPDREDVVSGFNRTIEESHMKKILACSALALGSIVAVHAQNAVSVNVKLAPLEAKIVTGQPYSAEIVSESVQTLADGNRIVLRSTGRVYRDTQGRVRREEDRPSGPPSISIVDPTRGVTVVLDQGSRTARETANVAVFKKIIDNYAEVMKVEAAKRAAENRTAENPPQDAQLRKAEAAAELRTLEVVLSGGRATGFVRKSGEEAVDEKLPDRMIEGVWAAGVRRTTTIAKGAIGNEQPIKVVSEEWTSPELQVLVLTDRTDPRAGRSTYRLLRIGLNEPDPSLFQVPPDYTLQRTGERGRGAPGTGGTPATGERGGGGSGAAPGTERPRER
jgi:hypothetical protein